MRGPIKCFIVTDINYESIRGVCNVCGHNVASYLCNASVIEQRPEAAQWDWWLACTNPECEHHYGCGYFQDEPAWYTYKPRKTIVELTKEQLAILDHTAHRAAGGLYCGDSDDMQALVASGLMESVGRKSFVPDEYFRLTSKGREALKARNDDR